MFFSGIPKNYYDIEWLRVRFQLTTIVETILILRFVDRVFVNTPRAVVACTTGSTTTILTGPHMMRDVHCSTARCLDLACIGIERGFTSEG